MPLVNIPDKQLFLIFRRKFPDLPFNFLNLLIISLESFGATFLCFSEYALLKTLSINAWYLRSLVLHVTYNW